MQKQSEYVIIYIEIKKGINTEKKNFALKKEDKLMKTIEVTNFKGTRYEGAWNEKTYKSNVSNQPDLYRIYVNDQPIHITEEEYKRLVAGNAEAEKRMLREKMERRRNDIKTMSLYEKADILRAIFTPRSIGYPSKKDSLYDAFSSTTLGSKYVMSLCKQTGRKPEDITFSIMQFIEDTIVALHKETESKELQVRGYESFENVIERLLRYQDMPETYYVTFNGVKLDSKDVFSVRDAVKKVFDMEYDEWKKQNEK